MPPNTAPHRLLTLPEVADELRLHRRTVERKIAAGELRAVRLGNGPNAPIRVDRDELAEWLAAHHTPRAEAH